MTIAIIGAGIAGLTAARDLVAAGRTVVILEKSGGLGGRLATRRTNRAAFDHGAPLAHGLPSDLAAAAGAIPWRDGLIGLPGNSSLGRALADGLDIRLRTRAIRLAAIDGGWRIACEDGADAQHAATLLLAVPAPQAVALLGELARGLPDLSRASMRPGWTLMAEFDAPLEGSDWRCDLGDPFALALRNAAKPGRPAGEAWVAHLTTDAAHAALEADAGATTQHLVAAFRAATGAPAPVFATAHRWRYARVAQPLGRPCVWDGGLRLGLAGDWCLGPDAGDAASSGRALAAAVNAAG